MAEERPLYRIKPDPHKIECFFDIHGPGMATEYQSHRVIRLHPDPIGKGEDALLDMLNRAYEAGKRARSLEIQRLISGK